MAYKNTYEDLLQDIQASGQNWSSYDLELAKANPDAGRSIYSQKQAWANAKTDPERKAANDAAEMIRKQYGGYTGGKDGGSFTLNGQYSASNTAPAYTQYASKYQGQIDSLMAQLANRPAFSYTATDDPSYAAYSEHYRNAGNQAREDTLARAAAMTGGQASTYAIAAAEQAQNAHNAKMSDIIPQLRDAAYGMYVDEGNAMRNDINTLMALDQMAYSQHQDAYASQLAEWEANYNVSRDLVEDLRYENELALAQAAAAAKGNGGSTSTKKKKEEEKKEQDLEGLYAAAWASGVPTIYIANNYEDYGFNKSTGLADAYYDEWVNRAADNGNILMTNDANTVVGYARKVLNNKGGDVDKLVDVLLEQGYSPQVVDQVLSALGVE